MTQASEISVGDKLWCTHRRLLRPMLGIIIALTSEPGKLIGLEFLEDVGGHSCDNRGKNGYCLWAVSEHVMTEAEYASFEAAKQTARDSQYQEYKKVILKP